jgi:putative ABC transport system permease protein
MTLRDIISFSLNAFRGNRVRTALVLVATAIGVAAVVVLTALGEGARTYVTSEFASLGSNLLIVLPGRSDTAGAGPAMFVAETPRDLTIDDALALLRSPHINRIAPLNVGSVPVSFRQRDRDVPVIGTTAEWLDIRHWTMDQGVFLPPGDPATANAVAVLGAKVRDELFGPQPALGEWVRLGDRRFRVIGILSDQGQSIGMNADEIVIVPVASAQLLFNSASLFRIFVETRSRADMPSARSDILATIRARHQGEEDVTVISQDAVLATFDKIFDALTYTVAAIASVSLVVSGILIMNVMLVIVAQRTAEIGLLKALGAPRVQILRLFLAEALLLSAFGAALGLLIGLLGCAALGNAFPALSFQPPAWAVIAASAVAISTGLLFGVLPARRAARLDPVQALSRR